MNEYQRHIEINAAVEQLLTNFMLSNKVTPIEIDNAILNFQLKIKDQIISNFLIQAQSNAMNNEENVSDTSTDYNEGEEV